MFPSKRFRKIFLIRFLAYLLTFTGLITVLLILEPVVSEEGRYRLDQLFNRRHSLPLVVTSAGSTTLTTSSLSAGTSAGTSPQTTADRLQPAEDGSQQLAGSREQLGFGSLAIGGSETIVPVDTNFGIVVEKINANARVIANVDPGNEREYIAVLSQGVAHAKGTVFPGQKGNIYLFSHSADAPWNIVRFNAIFYLLGKLDPGDRVILFYQGRRYDYIVFDKNVVGANDTDYLTRDYSESILTLQTCDPPGTLVNRMIVRARLAGS